MIPGCGCDIVPVRMVQFDSPNLFPGAGRWIRFSTGPTTTPGQVVTSPYQVFPAGRVVGIMVGPVLAPNTALKIVPVPDYGVTAGTSDTQAPMTGPIWVAVGGFAPTLRTPPYLQGPAVRGGALYIPQGVVVPWGEDVEGNSLLWLSSAIAGSNAVAVPDISSVTVFVRPRHAAAKERCS